MKGYVAKKGKRSHAVIDQGLDPVTGKESRKWHAAGKANTLATSTWHSYRRKIERHILPTLATIPIRRLTVAHLEALYDSKLRLAEARRPCPEASVDPAVGYERVLGVGTLLDRDRCSPLSTDVPLHLCCMDAVLDCGSPAPTVDHSRW